VVLLEIKLERRSSPKSSSSSKLEAGFTGSFVEVGTGSAADSVEEGIVSLVTRVEDGSPGESGAMSVGKESKTLLVLDRDGSLTSVVGVEGAGREGALGVLSVNFDVAIVVNAVEETEAGVVLWVEFGFLGLVVFIFHVVSLSL
jgi:hypothetical protein